jgi:hypothetical protein
MSDSFGHALPSPFQHGFRQNHSTTTATLTIQNFMARVLDKKKKVVVISTSQQICQHLLDKEIYFLEWPNLGFPRIYNDFPSN